MIHHILNPGVITGLALLQVFLAAVILLTALTLIIFGTDSTQKLPLFILSTTIAMLFVSIALLIATL